MQTLATTHKVGTRKARTHDQSGFTFMELVVVLTILSLLATLAVPVVTTAITRAKEATLKNNLAVTREAIDDYYSDTGRYPDSLDSLVEHAYLRTRPFDPIVNDDQAWDLVYSDDVDDLGVSDIKSSAPSQALDGSYYREW